MPKVFRPGPAELSIDATVAELLVDALAVARVTRLVTEDEISRPLREASVKLDPSMNHLGYLTSCPSCVSVWVAIVFEVIPRKYVPRRLRAALAVSELVWVVRGVNKALSRKG
jgi:hypothetical protein